MTSPSRTRDVVVIGASSGGLEALRSLLAALPPDIPAAFFIVIHMGSRSKLAQVLGRYSPLPVELAESGTKFRHGRIYVASPERHLLLHEDHMLLRRGPRENHSRPAIDSLFRTAAVSLGGRVIGILLSGTLTDGTAGLNAIKRCGGVTIVQDPADSISPEMPEHALRHVDIDYVASAAEIGVLLNVLTREVAGPNPEIPLQLRLEAAIAAQELADIKIDDLPGTPSRFTCPECHGALWEIHDGSLLRFRCHVGHAYTADEALNGRDDEIDRLLGTLLRSHQERAALTRRMSDHERSEGRGKLADQLARRAIEYDDDAQVMKALLRNGVTDWEMLRNAGESVLPHE
jgi:two-component system chemotaxis response regulator CheB